MDINIDKNALERMIARVRSMSAEDLAAKIEGYRGRSIGENLSSEFISESNGSHRYSISVLSDDVYEAVSASYRPEGSGEFQTFEDYLAANDDNYALAA